MRPGGGGVAAVVTKMNVLPLFSRAEQWPFKIPVHVPAAAYALLGIWCCWWRVAVLPALQHLAGVLYDAVSSVYLVGF